MAPLRFIELLPVADEVVRPDPEWLARVYMPRVCPVCKDVLPALVGPLDVEIQQLDLKIPRDPSGPLVTIRSPVRVDLVRDDLLAALRPHMRGYHFGAVRCAGRSLPRFTSVYAGDDARVPVYGDERSNYRRCSECGRENQRQVFGKDWFRADQVGDRLVFTGVGGVGLYVTKPIFDSFPASLRRELKRSEPVEVRFSELE